MKITPLIEHLKTGLPSIFQDRIAGVFDYKQKILEDVPRLPLPALYIELSPLTGASVYPENQMYWQYLEQHVFLYLELDNTTDQRGQTAQDKVDDFETAIFSLMVNYYYVPGAHPFEFVSSHGLYMDRARYIHQFDFKLIRLLTDINGFHGTYPDLKQILAGWELQGTNPLDFPNAENNIDDLNT